MSKKEQFLILMNNLISNDDADKKTLANEVYEHLKQCEFNPHLDEESKAKTVKLLCDDIENFVSQKENPAYKDNLKIQLTLFPSFIEN